MLKSVSYAQSQDETRYTLNGVYFNFKEGGLTLVATDGRRLALISKEMQVLAAGTGAIILPAKTVSELARILDKGDQVKINFSDRRCAFQIGTDKDTSGPDRQRLPLLEGGRGQLPETTSRSSPRRRTRGSSWSASCSCSASTARRWSVPRSPTRCASS